MARPVNRKCIECARLPIDEARQHPCWTDERERCHKRRSHYLKRGDRNTSRRVQYRSSRITQVGEGFSLPTTPTASIILVIYSEQPHHFKSSETPVHALGAELWVGTELKEQMIPELCCGKRGDEVALLPPLILEEFSNRFAQSYNQGKRFQRFAAKVHRHIQDCPASNPFQVMSGSAMR
ncbi:hypothetical protein IFO70_31115 [Phormidium tenue FACHB-886]|nr:hypothetical protein [Phormidium tenue FACHB-886]